jgi:chromosomal replication initiator protein DnaA
MRDLFISHAGEDKDAIARPLANRLRGMGFEVWYDEWALEVGDSLRRAIDVGLTFCRYGVVILSPAFFGKEWPQRELDALMARESFAGNKLILPIWHNMTAADVADSAPLIADRVALSTRAGLDVVATGLANALRRGRATDLNPRYGFESFTVGTGNQLAHAASLAVAGTPFDAYNPLFVCGPPGTGKTHLLQSIGRHILGNHPVLSVRYMTVDKFLHEFIYALRNRDTSDFRSELTRLDVLLIDDLQFIAGKLRSEEELFHVFNELINSGAQVVFGADRSPNDLQELSERLRQRLWAGLVANITPPDLELRRRVLHDRVSVGDWPQFEPGALDLIAERAPESMHVLEGLLMRVAAQHSLRQLSGSISASFTKALLDELVGPALGESAEEGDRELG